MYSLNVEAGKTATLKVSDTPKVTDTLIELFKIDMETQKDTPQGNASLEGEEFTWKVIRGGVKIQKRDLETEDTKPQGSATLKDTAFDIISLNDNEVCRHICVPNTDVSRWFFGYRLYKLIG